MSIDPVLIAELLAPLADRLPGRSRLTPAERAETIRIAQGFACKDSAAAANVSPETIRARRKRIYRKIGISGSNELISKLLGMSLVILASGRDADVRTAADTGAGAATSGADAASSGTAASV